MAYACGIQLRSWSCSGFDWIPAFSQTSSGSNSKKENQLKSDLAIDPWAAAMVMTKKLSVTIMLTGSDLLTKVKEPGDASKSDLVRSCGYVSTKKDGSERLNFTAFYEALLEVKGLRLRESGKGRRIGGHKLSYTTRIRSNGNLMMGKVCTAQLGLQPGDEFEIKLGKKQIRLVTVGGIDEEE